MVLVLGLMDPVARSFATAGESSFLRPTFFSCAFPPALLDLNLFAQNRFPLPEHSS